MEWTKAIQVCHCDDHRTSCGWLPKRSRTSKERGMTAHHKSRTQTMRLPLATPSWELTRLLPERPKKSKSSGWIDCAWLTTPSDFAPATLSEQSLQVEGCKLQVD